MPSPEEEYSGFVPISPPLVLQSTARGLTVTVDIKSFRSYQTRLTAVVNIPLIKLKCTFSSSRRSTVNGKRVVYVLKENSRWTWRFRWVHKTNNYSQITRIVVISTRHPVYSQPIDQCFQWGQAVVYPGEAVMSEWVVEERIDQVYKMGEFEVLHGRGIGEYCPLRRVRSWTFRVPGKVDLMNVWDAGSSTSGDYLLDGEACLICRTTSCVDPQPQGGLYCSKLQLTPRQTARANVILPLPTPAHRN